MAAVTRQARATPSTSGNRIQRQPADGDRLGVRGTGGRCPGAPQHRLDTGDELARRERLDDVVVGAHGQAEDLVHLLLLCGEHDDVGIRELPDLAASLDRVLAKAFAMVDGVATPA